MFKVAALSRQGEIGFTESLYCTVCAVLPMLIITSFGPLKLTLTTHHTTTFCNHISSTFSNSTNRRSPDVASTGEVAKDVESKTAMHKLQGIKHIEHECVMYEGVNHGCPVTDPLMLMLLLLTCCAIAG